jgi:deoxyribose-phosphate aldolase
MICTKCTAVKTSTGMSFTPCTRHRESWTIMFDTVHGEVNVYPSGDEEE